MRTAQLISHALRNTKYALLVTHYFSPTMTDLNFCPRCAHALEDQLKFGRLRRVCPNCGFIFFRAMASGIDSFRERLITGRIFMGLRNSAWNG